MVVAYSMQKFSNAPRKKTCTVVTRTTVHDAFQIRTMHAASSSSSLVTASAATTTATTVAAAAATTAAASTTATAATAAIFTRASFVDGERPAVVLLAVHSGNGRLRFFITSHFHEAEAFASTGVAVHDDFGALHSAVLTKNLIQI
jgi:hypothetical protein